MLENLFNSRNWFCDAHLYIGFSNSSSPGHTSLALNCCGTCEIFYVIFYKPKHFRTTFPVDKGLMLVGKCTDMPDEIGPVCCLSRNDLRKCSKRLCELNNMFLKPIYSATSVNTLYVRVSAIQSYPSIGNCIIHRSTY